MPTYTQLLKPIQLTEREDRFCYLIGYEQLEHEEAYIKAGNEKSCYPLSDSIKTLLSREEIWNKINYYLKRYLSEKGSIVASKTMVKLAENAESESVRQTASKWLLENEGFGVASRIADRNESQSSRSLSEYSLAELEELVKRGQETLAKLPSLKVLDISPSESGPQ